MRVAHLLLAAAALAPARVASQRAAFTPPPRREPIAVGQSAAIANLRAAVTRGDADAVARFWRELMVSRAPIVEPLPSDSGAVLATFVFRDASPAQRVFLRGGVAGYEDTLQLMERLSGTDVWFRTVRVPRDTRVGYFFASVEATPNGVAPAPRYSLDPFGRAVDSALSPRSIFEAPGAPPRTWSREAPGTPRGALRVDSLRSARLGQTRLIWIYTPPGYDAAAARRSGGLPFVVFFDGALYRSDRFVPATTILDNLIAAKRIPPVAALFVQNELTPPARMRELAPNPDFADFVAEELAPWAKTRVALSANPARAAVAGSSLGGIASSYVALRHPEVFGNVLSQSGSYWWAPDQNGEHEWLTRIVSTAPIQPVRFYMEVGLFEPSGRNGSPAQILSNRHLRDVLTARGYSVTYHEYSGAHEYLAWRETLPQALVTLFGAPPSSPSTPHDSRR
jgi:enterochelin esterase family protein